MAPPLFDAHCHLQDERLAAAGHFLQQIIDEAAAAGVQQLACNGCWQEDWPAVAAAAAAHPHAVVPNFGLHPWWLPRRSSDWLQQLRHMLEQHPHAGLGECGLDKGPRAPEGADWQAQLEAFEAQLQLAEELQRPVSIHCVRAFGAVHDALRRLRLSVPTVLHSWTGAAEMTTALAQLPGVHFSLSGHLLRVPPHKAMAMVRAIPLDRLLLESDSPDGVLELPPAWLEALPSLAALPAQLEAGGLSGVGALNRPCVLRCTLQLVAAALGRSEEEVAAASRENARRVFCSIGGDGGCGGSGDGGAAEPAG